MARVLALSSQVARGHVGLSAIVPALQALGHDVIALPTVVLSNHPGHAHVAGLRIPPVDLTRMVDALAANGWLDEVDAILTGYLPTAEHVAVAAATIDRIAGVDRARDEPRGITVLVDPVLGDHPKGLYIDLAAAEAIRDTLVRRADIVTPNAFELGWLTGETVQDVTSSVRAVRALGSVMAIVTSVPADGDEMLMTVRVDGWGAGGGWTLTPQGMLCQPDGPHTGYAWCGVRRRPRVPNGTGDLLAALYLGHRLAASTGDPLGLATAGVEAVVSISEGCDELDLAGARWSYPCPLSAEVETGVLTL